MSSPEQAPDGAPVSATAQPPTKKIDPVYYNWSSTFSIMLGRMTGSRDIALEQNYFSEMDALKADSICKRCESNRDYLMQYSPIIRFMRDEVAKLGGDLNDKNVICRMCTNEQSGGFSLDHGILLCANKFRNRGHQEDTMAHEMVHAWDHLKWKVEPENLRHQACLEACFPLLLLLFIAARMLTIRRRFAHPHSAANVASVASSSQKTSGASQNSCSTVCVGAPHCP